jgi:drug/metabolite transporter (DMT)-like permease
MLWLGAAVIAACLWGFSYAVAEHALKSGFSTAFMMVFYAALILPVFGLVALSDGSWKRDILRIKQDPALFFWLFASMAGTALGYVLILWAVKQKNATAVSFVEISYPFFVALFSWAIFQANNLTLGTILGGLLIFAGIAVMYLVK